MTQTLKICVPSFEPIGHKYQSDDGIELDSVTGICKSGLGIYQYKRMSAKAELGTNIHKACQYYDEKDLDEPTLDPVVKLYLDQYKLALKNEDIEILQNEVMRYQPEYLFAGTLDKIARVKGEMAIIDIKTGKVERWHWLQLAAYVELMKNEVGIKKIYALYLSDDSYSLVEYELGKGFVYFLALMASSKIKKELGY